MATRSLARASSVLFALMLALAAAFITIPASAQPGACGDIEHPSGNNRCDEEGGSGTQGTAESDPDDNGNPPERSNGGADKGTATTQNQDPDGTNGCGNDQNF